MKGVALSTLIRTWGWLHSERYFSTVLNLQSEKETLKIRQISGLEKRKVQRKSKEGHD